MAILRLVRGSLAVGSLLTLASLGAGCGDDEEPGCVAALITEVKTPGQTAASPLGRMASVRLERVDKGFALLGYDNGGIL